MIRYLALVGLAVSLSLQYGCSGKKTDDSMSNPDSSALESGTLGDSDSGKAMGLQTVRFAYDSFALDDSAKNILKENAKVLKDKASVKIQIEGHCDERGSIQYNIALGEKRASSTKKYLVDMGVSADRMTTISFGEERPVDNGHTDESWAKNRRSNFVVVSR